MAHINTKNVSGEKSTAGERTEFCYNCKYQPKKPTQKYCVDCFGQTNTGKLFCYVNWVENPDYHIRKRRKKQC